MSVEIEHRYLVNSSIDEIQKLAVRHAQIEQVYLDGTGNWSTRLRKISADRVTYLMTMKRKLSQGISKEIEHPITETTYCAYLNSGFVKRGLLKTRYYVPQSDRLWEVDVFEGKLAGLIIAEIELDDVNDRDYAFPFDGREITGKKKYSNASLSHKNWLA